MLTDTAIRNAKPSTKQTKLYDEKGLFLLVTPRGGKWWRLKYRFEGKEKQLSLGTYPDTGLKDARAERDKARKLLAQSIDPAEHRKTTRHQRAEAAENTRAALQLAPLVFVRPDELRRAEWEEFNLAQATWYLPAEKMKARQPHIVPLSTQAVEILLEIHNLTGTGRYVFPGARSRKKPMSENTINACSRK